VGVTGLALSALVLSGCAASASSSSGESAPSSHPGTLTWARPAASNGWEGDKCVDTSIPLNPAVYDTLLRIETPSGDGLAPGLAETWEWDDASLSYVFHLRDNAMFSNGDPLTAADVVFSVNEWLTGEFSSSYYANVDHAEAVDDSTVKIVMKQVDTFLPSLLTWCTSPIYPSDFAGETRDAFFQSPIGAGPYAVSDWEDPMGTSEKITLVPNEHYYGWKDGAAPLDTIVVETITDPNQRALEFQAGDVDLLEAVDSATATQMSPDQLRTTTPNPIQTTLVNETAPGLSNPDVRQAFSLALDRDTLAATLADGSVPAEGALPINVPGWVAPSTPYSYDPDEAKALLAASGETDLTFTLLYDASDHSSDVLAQAMQAQLAEVGITLEFETTDGNTVIARQSSSDFELSLTSPSAISPTVFDPISWIAIQYTWTGSPSTLLQDEFLAGTSTTDDAEAAKSVLAVQDFITTDNGMVGLVNSASTYAAQTWVEGFDPLQYRTFYFDTLAG
jgi:ABC-type transport system substrate-binding protein